MNQRTPSRHTCDTARSGSERSENTCTACHEERDQSTQPRGYGDLVGRFEREHGPRTETTTK